jgi:hypothetical protein
VSPAKKKRPAKSGERNGEAPDDPLAGWHALAKHVVRRQPKREWRRGRR